MRLLVSRMSGQRTVLVITKRRVVGLWQPLLARSKTAEPLRAGVDNPPKADASVGRIQPDNGAGRSRAEEGGVEQGLTTQIELLNRTLVVT